MPKQDALPLCSDWVPGLVNFRDIALAHPLLRHGVLYRGGCLYGLTNMDAAQMQQRHGIKTVIDLRTLGEREWEPETVLPGARYHIRPLLYGGKNDELGLYKRILLRMVNLEEAEAFVTQVYVRLVNEQWEDIVHVLELLQECEPPIFMHCRHGRDRTGLLEAILLKVLGIPYSFLLQSFLLSNLHMKEKNSRDFIRMSQGMDSLQKAQLWCMFEAREVYLKTALEAISRPVDKALQRGLKRRLLIHHTHALGET